MKYLIIDDNKQFAEALCKQMSKNAEEGTCNWETLKLSKENDSVEINRLEQHTIKEIADALIETYNPANDKEIIIFINVNLLTIENSRQLQKGIELLIWLRIKGVMNHVVLYSFEDLHTILNREPKHLIATSQGTTFVRLPNNFQRITEILEILKTDNKLLAIHDNIKTALKPAINIESIRHQEANWWGIKQVWDVHRIVKAKSKKDFPYPSGVLKAEKDLVSNICQLIYQADEVKLGSALKTTARLKKGSSIHIPSRGNWNENVIDENNHNNYTIEQIAKSLHYILEKRSPKILHIDDQWKDGWGEIFCEIIYGEIANKFQQTDKEVNSHKWNNKLLSIKPTEPDFTNINNYLKGLDLDNFDLIVLDLRLDPKKDNLKNRVRDMSGALFLQEIRNMTKGIPVLMTTASNKIWSFQELNKLGADAYWMKEGVDNFNDAENTVMNYHKLIFTIENLTNSSHQNLKKYYKQLNDLRCNKNLWWKKRIEWKREINTTINLHNHLSTTVTIPQQTISESYELDSAKKEDVIVCFEQVLVKLRNYLMSYEIDFEVQADDKVLSWHLRGIINDLGAICEIIHNDSKLNSKQIGGEINERKIEINRGDWIAQLLYTLRNKASHYSESKEIDKDNVFKAINYILKWLKNPKVNHLPKSTNPVLKWNEIEEIIEKCLAPNTP